MRSFLSLALLISLVTSSPTHHKKAKASTVRSVDQTKPPAGAVVVDASGSISGSFKTVQAGVDALDMNSTKTQTLFIMGGTYNEQVYIQALKSPLVVLGETTDSSSYTSNKVTIINNISRNTVANNDLTATVRNWTPNSKFYNLNIENNFGHTNTNGQNLAISAQATNQGYYGCSFVGYQDTILAQTGTQLYAKCFIVGVVDFIFGQKAKAWFEGVDIRTFDKGYITASGRDTEANDSWYVINKSTVAARDSNVAAGSTVLGRPWKAFARVVFQNSELSDVVNAVGWSQWNAATPNTNQSYLAEYGNTGAGAAKEGRAAFAKQLDAPVTIESILGASWASASYVDSTYM
ncbi:pectin lyase fold/virulence factor [Leptodontidium sp. 2 PMI_412]|nr:pectin lyase fold/virulence factor [Leptodontidium sp. MPI-SDFR-AT-0119]KAH9216390.1 pectin lyase fold/virulence factor [Leptodontidium sp. 2 PMI_412]